MKNDYAVMITFRDDYNKSIQVTYSGNDLSPEELKSLILEDLKVEVRIIPKTPSMKFNLKDKNELHGK